MKRNDFTLRRSWGGFWLGFVATFLVVSVQAKDKGLDVLISADAISSPQGFRPQPNKPIHYLLFQSRQTLGTPVGGVKLPSLEVVERALTAELKKQGFVKTGVDGPAPDILIFAVLGDSNFKDEVPLGNPWNDDDFRTYLQGVSVRQVKIKLGLGTGGQSESIEVIFDEGREPYVGTPLQEALVAEARRLRNLNPARKRKEIDTLIGWKKADRALAAGTMSDSAAKRIAGASFNDQFYLSLSAVEAKKQRDGGRGFLWRTTMLIDWRENFSEALPVMLAEAGPMFGTDAAVPGFVNSLARSGKVDIGEAQVVPEKNSATKPVLRK